jgi:glycosyltransferase involved in cell wall biosynthesis
MVEIVPQLSIVIPVRDGGATIAAQLDALATARKPAVTFEVVVADNGSTDQTGSIVQSYADRLPVRLVDASHVTGANLARNCGVEHSRGAWLLFCDADDEVDVGWLEKMARAFADGEELIAGPIDYERLNAPEVCAWRGARRASVSPMMGFLPAAQSANLGVTRRVFDLVDGFDTEFTGAGEDIDFIWRAQLAGTPLQEVPNAVVHYRLRSSLLAHWHQSISYGACEAQLYARYAPAGMSRRPIRVLVNDVWWLITRLPFAWPIGRRGAWLRRAGQRWGRIVGAVGSRVLWW